MEDKKFNKTRFSFLKECYNLNKRIRVQDFQRTKGKSEIKDLRHYLLHNILNKGKSYFSLIEHDELLRYPIESDEVTEIRFDLDYKELSKEENIKTNLKLGKILHNKLKEKGLKGFFYYSGGKGIHCSFLLSTKGLGFRYSLNDIDLNQYEKEFTGEPGEVINLIDKSNLERSSFKKCFYSWLHLPQELLNVLDYQMCSSKTLLTLECAKKRNAGSKHKTYIDYDKFSLNQLETYILNTEYKPYIEMKFFKDIVTLSEPQIKEIFSFMINDKPKTQIEPLNKPKVEEVFYNVGNEDIAKVCFITLHTLYKKYNLTSNNSYLFYCSKVLLHKTRNKELTLKYLKLIQDKLNLSFNGNLDNKVDSAKESIEKGLVSFNFKDYFTTNDFNQVYNYINEVIEK